MNKEIDTLKFSSYDKFKCIADKYSKNNTNLLELKIREALINVIQEENFLLEDKLIISFQMLLTILENENFREDDLLEELEKYNNKVYIQELIDMYREIEINIDDSIEEINNLFLDITENYKEVSALGILLLYERK